MSRSEKKKKGEVHFTTILEVVEFHSLPIYMKLLTTFATFIKTSLFILSRSEFQYRILFTSPKESMLFLGTVTVQNMLRIHAMQLNICVRSKKRLADEIISLTIF